MRLKLEHELDKNEFKIIGADPLDCLKCANLQRIKEKYQMLYKMRIEEEIFRQENFKKIFALIFEKYGQSIIFGDADEQGFLQGIGLKVNKTSSDTKVLLLG